MLIVRRAVCKGVGPTAAKISLFQLVEFAQVLASCYITSTSLIQPPIKSNPPYNKRIKAPRQRKGVQLVEFAQDAGVAEGGSNPDGSPRPAVVGALAIHDLRKVLASAPASHRPIAPY